MAAVIWVGAICFELYVVLPAWAATESGPPDALLARFDATMREVVQAALVVFLASGAMLTFERLSRGAADTTYAVILGVKIIVSLAMFQVGFRFRNARGERRVRGLRIMAVFGLVVPSDPIPDHKLKMSVSIGRMGKLSTWWRAPISAALSERAGGRAVWDLLPLEHSAAVDLGGVPRTTVVFLEPNARGELVAVAHWNKLLKGALVRHLLENPGTDAADLADWEHPEGFVLDADRTVVDGALTTLFMVRR